MSDTSKDKDKVEREIVIRAPIARVFAGLTDPAHFPSWGPERIEGKLAVGERPILDFGAHGKAAIYVVAFEPPAYFAYRWVQGVTDPAIVLDDPLKYQNTLVEFRLEENAGQTRVRVTESGLGAMAGVPGLDVDAALDNMGKGWELMLDGLGRRLAAGESDSRP